MATWTSKHEEVSVWQSTQIQNTYSFFDFSWMRIHWSQKRCPHLHSSTVNTRGKNHERCEAPYLVDDGFSMFLWQIKQWISAGRSPRSSGIADTSDAFSFFDRLSTTTTVSSQADVRSTIETWLSPTGLLREEAAPATSCKNRQVRKKRGK